MDEGRLPFLARKRELDSLVHALRNRQSRLITGPSGTGKRRLIDEALAHFTPPHVRIRSWPEALHQLLVALAAGLGCQHPRHPDLRKVTSSGLKSAILDRLTGQPRCIILEQVRNAEPKTYRFLQEIYHLRDCCLIVASENRAELGYLGRLLWDPREEIALKPLSRRDACVLFDAAASRFGLETAIAASIREKTVSAAHGIPGQIIAMCRLAQRQEYRDGMRIMFVPLRIDALISTKL
jgi:hypothetical protein